jgi:hypothetical protein
MEKPLFAAMDQILAFWPYVAAGLNLVLACGSTSSSTWSATTANWRRR